MSRGNWEVYVVIIVDVVVIATFAVPVAAVVLISVGNVINIVDDKFPARQCPS
jgi:hypothetical protein